MEAAPGSMRADHGDIVVGLDTHDGWERPLDWAVDQAVLEGRALTIVHAMDGPESLWRSPGGHETRIGVLDRPAPPQLFLDDARVRALTRAPELIVHEVLHSGGPREVLSATASDAHVLVIGARHRGHMWPRLVGSVSASIARRPPSAVVVVHADPRDDRHDGVLVGVDDTGSSQAALRFAFAQASLHGWPLTVMHVAPETISAGRDAERQQEERLHLANALAGASEDYPDVPVRTVVEQGDPAHCLLAASRATALVVVGAHHGRGISDVLLGSVVVPVVERARCSVAVVPSQRT
jgi:nucleotide-binding universal stress UspA family protein